MPESHQLEPPPLSPEQKRRGQKLCILVTVFGTTAGVVFSGSVFTLFLLSLGASASAIGFYLLLTRISVFAQAFTVRRVKRGGKARFNAWATLLRSLLSLPIAVAPLLLLRLPASWVLGGVILFSVLSAVAIQAGQTAWWPLLQDVSIPGERGKFFSTMRLIYRSAQLAAALAVGLFLGRQAEPAKYLPLLFIGVLFILARAAAMLRMPERQTPQGDYVRTDIRGALGRPRFRRLLALSCLFTFSWGFVAPYFVIYLRDLNFSPRTIVLAANMMVVGMILTLKPWGYINDKGRTAAILKACMAGFVAAVACWLLVRDRGTFSTVAAFTVLLFVGAATAGWGIGWTEVVLDVVPEKLQVECFTTRNWLQAAAGGLGNVAGGTFYQGLQHWHGQVGSLTVAGTDFFFLGGMALMATCLFVFSMALPALHKARKQSQPKSL